MTRKTSHLKEPRLSILIAKNALSPGDYHYLNEVETDNLYDNIIHSAMESALYPYMAKERNKTLRQEFEAQEKNKNLLQEECLRLKARVEEVETTVKETLEFVDKLQANLDEANISKLAFEDRAKNTEDQVAILQC